MANTTEPRKLVRFDWFIKKMLRSKADFEILEGFLSELLKENVEILEIVESESNKKYVVENLTLLYFEFRL